MLHEGKKDDLPAFCLSEILAETPVRKDEEEENKLNLLTHLPGKGGRHPRKDR